MGRAPRWPAHPVASASVSVSAPDEYVSVDATQAVQNWLNGVASNNGFNHYARQAVALNAAFDSKESATTSHPATLTVTLASSQARQEPQDRRVLAGSNGATGARGPARAQPVQLVPAAHQERSTPAPAIWQKLLRRCSGTTRASTIAWEVRPRAQPSMARLSGWRIPATTP